MKNDMDDLLNAVFGSRRTLATPADKAEVPTLEIPSAKKSASPAAPAPDASRAAAQSIDAIQKAVPEMSKAINERLAQQQEEIALLTRSAQDDIARIKREVQTPAVQNLADESAPAHEAGTAGVGAEGFDGLADVLAESVFGQAAYLAKLVIALKRPYVMGHAGDSARGFILVTGKPFTGRHTSLTCAAAELKRRGVLASEEIAWLDLSLYPTSAEEKLFLQDLYMALASNAELVAFTHYERCYSGFLGVLSALVLEGKSPLATRYVLQNGRLIDAGNALVQNAVSALTPRGKYLVFVTERPAAKLADSFGAPFVSALTDICETSALDAQALDKLAEKQLTELTQNARKNLKYNLTADDGVKMLGVNAAAADTGAKGLLDFFSDVYKALAQYALEHESGGAVSLTVENGALRADFGTGALDLLALLPGSYHGALEEVKAEMESIVGLTEIKKYILSLEDNYKIQQKRAEQGLKTASVSMHMIFTGNPGTGKTTIARLVSKYLKAIGVLSGGQLVEVTRADVVGKYVGHTAPLTTQVIKSAIGGVLFIDEAYSLYRGKDDSFGLEAIDTLVKGMEDNRDNLLVILAGYSKEMAEFLTANSGLKSRFPNIMEFPDYTGEELLAIAKLQAKGKGYCLDEACDAVLLSYFNAVQLSRARDAGNGRLARNKIEEAILNQSKRLIKEPDADLSLLTTQDFSLDDVQG